MHTHFSISEICIFTTLQYAYALLLKHKVKRMLDTRNIHTQKCVNVSGRCIEGLL